MILGRRGRGLRFTPVFQVAVNLTGTDRLLFSLQFFFIISRSLRELISTAGKLSFLDDSES